MRPIFQPTPEQERVYREWVEARPPAVRAVAQRFTPWGLYRMRSTGHLVTLASFGEEDDGRVTLRVRVLCEFNPDILFQREVFGVDPDALEAVDAPEVARDDVH